VLAVRQQRDPGDPAVMAVEAAQFGAGIEVPQAQCAARGAGQGAPAVGQRRDCGDRAVMAV
jgi:hypothetical protein